MTTERTPDLSRRARQLAARGKSPRKIARDLDYEISKTDALRAKRKAYLTGAIDGIAPDDEL